MTETRRTTSDEAKRVGDEIGVDWSRFDLEQFRLGMDVEYEHGSHDPQTDVTHDDPILTGKIALAHMKEFPDYYERLERMEAEAARDWATKPVLSPASSRRAKDLYGRRGAADPGRARASLTRCRAPRHLLQLGPARTRRRGRSSARLRPRCWRARSPTPSSCSSIPR